VRISGFGIAFGSCHGTIAEGKMKRTPRATIAARERYWTKIIQEARKYPTGVTAYCRDKDVGKNNYYFWFKRLREHHPEWHDLTNRPEVEANIDTTAISKSETTAPPTEVKSRPRRRKFSASDKAKLLLEADNASPTQLAAILRGAGLYLHHLQKWRTERDMMALVPKKRGPQANPLAAENKQLKEENVRLAKKLHQATEIIKLQKKVSELLGVSLQSIQD
jgi:transposase